MGHFLDGFTLMAACQDDSCALEKIMDGKTYGIYIYEVLRYLNQIWPRVVTYLTLRNQRASQMQSQTPAIYGQDRLAVFRNKEPVSAAPVFVEIRKANAILPVGRIHGVKKGAQFATCPPSPDINLTIDWVDDFKCGTKIALLVWMLTRRVQQMQMVWLNRSVD